MTRLLGHLNSLAFAALRVVLAFLYLSHGLRWLFGAFGGEAVPLMSLLGAAGIIETVCGTLILVGWWTSLAAFVASGEMAFAYFIAHVPRGGMPIQNGGEITVALCFGFLYIATRGGGPISLDRLLGRGKR
jgi:putative oxidoreductase